MILLATLLLSATFTRSLERVNSIDPIESQTIYDSHAVQLVYRTPLAIDYEARPYRLVPGACELPEVSEDGLTYVFRMAPDDPACVPVTGEDILRGLQRLKDPKNASPGGWTMKSVETMRVREDGALEFRLKERSHVFPWMMAMSYAGIRTADGGETGPFTLASWRKNHEMVFRRRLPVADGFDTVRYLVIGDVSTQWLMFLKGELDYLGEISRDNWDAVVGVDGNLDPMLVRQGVSLVGAPTMDVRYIGFNMRDKVVGGNRKLRQALACAFDFPTWQAFYNGRIDPADGPVPRGVAGRLEAPPAYPFDLARAKRLLAEAGYPDGIDPTTGKRLVLTLSMGVTTSDGQEAGELLASFFARLGIRLELSRSLWGSFLRAVNEGRVQMYMMGWVGDYPDAENFLQLFHSKNRSPGPNHSDYENPEFDAEFDAAMACADAEARNVHWRRCQEIIREDCPWIFTHFPKLFTLVRPTVGNYKPSVFPYGEERHFKTGETK